MVGLLAPRDPARSIPFDLRDQDSRTGARLGGQAPDGVRPREWGPRTVYLATLPVVPAHSEVSIFLTERADNDLLINGGRLYQGPDFGPVGVALHEPSRRGHDDALRSPLSARAIVLGAEQDDWYTSGMGERSVLGRHKIGGRPAIFKEWDLEDSVARLLYNRFVQILQLDFPGPEDDIVGGDWPFGDGMFHLLGRDPFGEGDWACFWEN